MTNSTKRGIRTGIQAIFGVLAGLAIVLPILGTGLGVPALVAAGATVVTISGVAAKAWNALEASGKVPSWLADAITPDSHDH